MPNVKNDFIPEGCGDYHEYDTTSENKQYWDKLTLEEQEELMWEAFRNCKDIRVIIECKRLREI